MKNEIWILGATGRSGRHVASLLANRGVALVLVGRSRETLDALATSLPGDHRILVGSLEQNLAQLSSDAPGVVVNTVGPFATTATQVAGALHNYENPNVTLGESQPELENFVATKKYEPQEYGAPARRSRAKRRR